ncbi:MAG: hypothetical protein ACLUEN_00115 [Coprococcus sp.]
MNTKTCKGNKKAYYSSGIMVHLNKYSMEWFIENKSMISILWQLPKHMEQAAWMLGSIFEASLNLKTGML